MASAEATSDAAPVVLSAPTNPTPSSPLVSECGRRFYRSPRWRHVLTTLDTTNIAVWDKLVSDRTGRFELGGPAFLEGHVPSDDPRVNIVWEDNFTISESDPYYYNDGGVADYPHLAEGVRLMYSFRQEGTDGWVCRHAGPILELEDVGSPDSRTSRFIAYDPWAYLYSRPCLTSDLELPGTEGVNFLSGTEIGEIALELLRRTIVTHGPVFLDAGAAWGGTADYGGTIETTDTLVATTSDQPAVNFPPGTSVGQAWEQLVDTGKVDIVIDPLYDPDGRPGYCGEVSIYTFARQYDPFVDTSFAYPTFHWDRSGRAILEMGIKLEGRERANRIQFYTGGTGIGGKLQVALQSDTFSSARFGQYWLLAQLTKQSRGDRLLKMAQDELFRLAYGKKTVRILPTPEFSPRPFQDYKPGWFCDFYHSRRLRQEQWWQPNQFNDQIALPRIIGFTIALSDDTLETVTALDVTLGTAIPQTA